MASKLYSGFETFDISVDPEVVIHGIRGGTGPPLLLLHGFPQTHLIWYKVAPYLVAKYTLVIPDLRGYGASSKPSVNWKERPSDHRLYAKSAMAQDCATLMTRLGYDLFFVCGHDRGGRVAHKLCVDHPARVRACIFLDICPTKAMYEGTSMYSAHAYWHWYFLTQPAPFPEKLMMASPDLMSEKSLKGKAGDLSDKAAIAEYKKQFTEWDSTHAMCEDYRASMKEDIEEQKADIIAAKKIKSPFLVLWGKEGVIEKFYDAKAEWEAVSEPGLYSEKSRALNCGHYIPEEAPEELVKYIQEFFI